jgi:hypothetical protein
MLGVGEDAVDKVLGSLARSGHWMCDGVNMLGKIQYAQGHHAESSWILAVPEMIQLPWRDSPLGHIAVQRNTSNAQADRGTP